MTKQLTIDAFERAGDYLFAHGRPLEQALFAYHFESGDQKRVLDALAAYQNEDGGFGRALEPDLRTDASSAVATSQGLYILREVNAAADEPLVQRSVAYLLDTFDAEKKVWPIIPPEADEAPRAWWWDYGDSAANFGSFLINPTVAITGHLCHYHRLLPPGFLVPLLAAARERLEQKQDEIDMYDLFCYVGLLEANHLPESDRETIRQKLMQVVPNRVVREPEQWGQHGLRPLDVATSPDAPLTAAVAPALVEANLDFDIDHQQSDGSWQPTWSWAERFPEAWIVAEQEWKGIITLARLRTLRAYGR
jgi:hypothetical protein